MKPLGLLAAGLAALYALGLPLGRLLTDHDVVVWPALATLGWLGCLGAAAHVWHTRGRAEDRGALLVVLAAAAVFRLPSALAPPALSSDLHRYLWDGRVQAAGVSPYLLPPAAPELAPLRTPEVHPRINRPEAVTVYPPGAQALFLGLHALHVRTATGLRLAMAALDLLAVLLLAALLHRRGQPPARVVLYAWAPLAVGEHAGNAHLEALVILLLAGTLLSWRDRRPGRAGLLLGLATLVKLYPVVLVAALRGRGERRLWLAGAATVAAGYLAYGLQVGPRVLGFLPSYVRSAEDFNVGLRALFELLLSPLTTSPRTPAFALCLVALAVALVVLATRREDRDDPEARSLSALGATLLLMPTAFHAWYATPLLALACLAPAAAWLWLAGALPWSYLKYASDDGQPPAWVRPLEFVPTFLLLGLDALRGSRRRPRPGR